MQQGVRVSLGLLYCHTVGIGVLRDIDLINGCCGESCIGSCVPEHRYAATCPEAGAVGGRSCGVLLEADLVSVVDERHARHREEEGHRHLQLLGIGTALGADTVEVVIAGRHTDIAVAFHGIVLVGIEVIPGLEPSCSSLVEIRQCNGCVRTEASASVEEQRGIVVLAVVAEEVKVETGLCHGLRRVEPFCDQHSLGIFTAEPFHQVVFPELDGGRFVGIVLHQTGGHIHTESIDTLVHPE